MARSETRSDGLRRVANCLYRYDSTGGYFVIVKYQGKLIKRSLKTQDLPEARRLLRDFQTKLARVDIPAGKITLAALCDDYLEGLSQDPKTTKLKREMVARLKRDWPAADGADCQVSAVKPADTASGNRRCSVEGLPQFDQTLEKLNGAASTHAPVSYGA